MSATGGSDNSSRLLNATLCRLCVFGVDFDPDSSTTELFGHKRGGTGAEERIDDRPALGTSDEDAKCHDSTDPGERAKGQCCSRIRRPAQSRAFHPRAVLFGFPEIPASTG